MGKAGRWLKSFLSGKKDRPHGETAAAPPASGAPPKDKRWSFRRPAAQEGKAAEAAPASGRGGLGLSAADIEFDQKKHAVAVAVATAAAADAAVAAAHAAAAVARLSSRRSAHLPASLAEDAAAVRIQATFRGYLARTALCALRGIVKLQALVRGQLVRKQANATLRCMQALLTAQSHLRACRPPGAGAGRGRAQSRRPPGAARELRPVTLAGDATVAEINLMTAGFCCLSGEEGEKQSLDYRGRGR